MEPKAHIAGTALTLFIKVVQAVLFSYKELFLIIWELFLLPESQSSIDDPSDPENSEHPDYIYDPLRIGHPDYCLYYE